MTDPGQHHGRAREASDAALQANTTTRHGAPPADQASAQLATVAEAAAEFRVSEASVLALIEHREFAATTFPDGSPAISRLALDAFRKRIARGAPPNRARTESRRSGPAPEDQSSLAPDHAEPAGRATAGALISPQPPGRGSDVGGDHRAAPLPVAYLLSLTDFDETVLQRLTDDGRRTISLPGDLHRLEEACDIYKAVLDDTADRGLLHRVAQGKYVIVPPGTTFLQQAVTDQVLADLILRDVAPDYYLTYLSAFIHHWLTDLHTTTINAVVHQRFEGTLPSMRLGGWDLRVTRMAANCWPRDDSEVDVERVWPDESETVRWASLSRTLIDGLARPDLCAGIDTVIRGWGRASRRTEFDPEEIWEIARWMPQGTLRRVALLLINLEHVAIVQSTLDQLQPLHDIVGLDISNDWPLRHEDIEVDSYTGVAINLPERALTSWLGEELG